MYAWHSTFRVHCQCLCIDFIIESDCSPNVYLSYTKETRDLTIGTREARWNLLGTWEMSRNGYTHWVIDEWHLSIGSLEMCKGKSEIRDEQGRRKEEMWSPSRIHFNMLQSPIPPPTSQQNAVVFSLMTRTFCPLTICLLERVSIKKKKLWTWWIIMLGAYLIGKGLR